MSDDTNVRESRFEAGGRREMVSCPTVVRKKNDPLTTEAARKVAELLWSLRYGSITLVVQDGKVAQIDKMEKHRLGNGS